MTGPLMYITAIKSKNIITSAEHQNDLRGGETIPDEGSAKSESDGDASFRLPAVLKADVAEDRLVETVAVHE